MKSSITLFGLAASVHALESSYSQCTNSSVYHATIISTRASTATFTSVPTNMNHAPGQSAWSSSLGSTAVTSAHTSTGSTISIGDGAATTYSSTAVSSSSVAPINTLSSDASTASHVQPSVSDNSPSASNAPSNLYLSSSSLALATTSGTPSTSQRSSQSLHNPLTTMATTIPASASNSSSPRTSLVAYTGSSSATTFNGGAMILGLFVSILLL